MSKPPRKMLHSLRQYLWKGYTQNHPNQSTKKHKFQLEIGRSVLPALQWQRQIADCFSWHTISWFDAQIILQLLQMYVTIGTNTFYISWLSFVVVPFHGPQPRSSTRIDVILTVLEPKNQ